eukprot:TRINITY_DN5113_c0_g1_i1.p1 TRINITY_DN5113_c0_g1~~TRINITY_DN5113_c0_g1_i1.p1  ORF type:complete len:320 (-),score=31.25 TRINITY_DN5113_c0_g1_i1:306-1265(-)
MHSGTVTNWLTNMLLSDATVKPDTWVDFPRDAQVSMDQLTPCSIGGLAIRECMGTANSASVYRAVQIRERRDEERPEREFVAKIHSEQYAEGDFAKELHFLRAVQGHPNVMFLAGYREHPPRTIVIPLYESGLCEYLCEREPLIESDAALLVFDILKAVAHIHRYRVLHRNIKPVNVAVKQGACVRAVLMNFASACHTWDNFATQASFGAIGYVAPEVVLGFGFTSKSDVFGVGCLLYFMIERRSPFDTDPFDLHASLRSTALCDFTFGTRSCSLSIGFKEIITSFLMRKPRSRLSALDLLAHPWFADVLRGCKDRHGA